MTDDSTDNATSAGKIVRTLNDKFVSANSYTVAFIVFLLSAGGVNFVKNYLAQVVPDHHEEFAAISNQLDHLEAGIELILEKQKP